MNYSVMTTRSVIWKKSSANICTVFWGGWAEQGIDGRTPLKINMTNWQIICSIRIAEQVCRWGACATRWHSYQAKPEAWWEIPCLCDSDLEQCTRRIPQEKKKGYSPWYSLKFDCRRHPAPSPPPFHRFILLLLAPQLPDWTFQDHFLLIHKTYSTGDWIEGSSGAAKHEIWKKISHISASKQAGGLGGEQRGE